VYTLPAASTASSFPSASLPSPLPLGPGITLDLFPPLSTTHSLPHNSSIQGLHERTSITNMDRSFGSSTSTLLATPTPLERKSRTSLSSSTFLANNQLAQSINAGTSSSSSVLQPLTFQRSTTALSGPTTKAVRFSPAHPSTTGGFSNAYSSAPSSRVQSIATPPRSQSSPSLSALNRTSSYGLGSGAAATPPRPQQVAQQVQQKVQAAVGDPGKAVQEIKQKLQVTPIGRGEAARRLRVNAVLLVAWWVSSRTAGYR
jgi:hypothetical protein